MTSTVVTEFSQTQWLADLSPDDARAALQRTMDLAYEIASGKLGSVDSAEAAYLIRVAIFDSARGTVPVTG